MRPPPRLRRILRQLEDRGVLRVAGVYAAAAFVILQVADLVLPALPLPESAYTVVVLLTLVGFPVAVGAAWLFDLTETGVRRSPATLEEYERVEPPAGRRVRALPAATIVLLLVVAGGLLAFRTIWGPEEPADRIAIAVFPFGSASGEWTEGVPDLLTTALDGAESTRVLDPWALWTVLRKGTGAPAQVPDPARASLIASDRNAHRYVLGSVVEVGDRVEVVARLYRTGRAEPVETFRIGGPVADLAALVDRLAVGIMTRVAGEVDPLLATLQGNATRSPEALKAYLAARAAMRQGRVDSAVTAVERAVALDSTFALAWLESVHVHSWAQHMRGEPYTGLLDMLARAEAHADSLTERGRLRLAATRALLETDGPAAASALGRILERDSTDLGAWSSLAYCHMVYGWQYQSPPEEAIRATERVMALDSTYVPALATRAWLAVTTSDSAAARRTRAALEARAGDSYLGRSTLDALRSLDAPDSLLPGHAEELARRSVGDWVTPYRYLRLDSPERAERFLAAAAAVPDPQIAGRVAGEQFRLGLARGRLVAVGEGMASGRYGELRANGTGARFLAAAALAGVGDSALAARAATSLAESLPPDSAGAWFETRPIWWTAWTLGAYQAQLGDSTRARVWQEVIGSLPEGGTSPDYRGALQADIEARLLGRRGDLDGAIVAAERAMELWGIHTENAFEALPEPQMRFHLASLRKAAGDVDAARWLFRSLVPPASWFGFLSARAWFELGALAEDDGDLDAARRNYEHALALWEVAEGPMEVWRDQARRAWARTLERGE